MKHGALALLCCAGAEELPRTFLWQAGDLLQLKRLSVSDASMKKAVEEAAARADGWLTKGPWTVTSKPKELLPDGADMHDYVSMDKYYWPCTASPGAALGALAVSSDPTCDAGVLHTGSTPVCCPLSCESCSGSGCSADADDCCLSNILASNRSCNEHEAPCIVASDACDETTGHPYVRHDGLVNPETEKFDHDGLENMTAAVIDLSLAAFYAENSTFADRAAKVLRTWFLDESTRMNPNLQWGHFTPGWCDQMREGRCEMGDHGSFIDSHWNPELLDAAALLRYAHPTAWLAEDQEGLLSWFGEFLNWTNTSVMGAQEQSSANNHGVWFDAQTLAVALHVGPPGEKIAKSIADLAGEGRLAVQAESSGALPAEEARTKAFSYSNFALMGFMHLATLIDSCRQEGGACAGAASLFDFQSTAGASLRGVVEYQAAYVVKPDAFPFQQIVPFFYPECTENMVDQCLTTYFWPLRKAAQAFRNSTFEEAIRTIDGLDYAGHWVNLVLPRFGATSEILV